MQRIINMVCEELKIEKNYVVEIYIFGNIIVEHNNISSCV